MLDLNEKELNIFAASFFDAEGTIVINRLKRKLKSDKEKYYYYVHLRICNKNAKVLQIIQKNMKLGKIYCNNIKSGKLYNLHLYGQQVFEFIERIYPYCIVKKSQLDEIKTFSLELPADEKETIYKNLQILKRQEEPYDESVLS